MVTAGLAFAWLPEHLVMPAIAAGTARPLPLIFGAARHVSLSVVLVHGQVAGPAAREAVQRFYPSPADHTGRASVRRHPTHPVGLSCSLDYGRINYGAAGVIIR